MTSSFLSVTAATSIAAVLGYAVYFDYKRRNDVEFRRALKLEKKLAQQAKLAQQQEAEQLLLKMLADCMALVKDVSYPQSPEDREQFFTACIQDGDNLMRSDPQNLPAIAAAYFKAVKSFPNPSYILDLLQKSVPEDIFALVYAMIKTEVELFSSAPAKITEVE